MADSTPNIDYIPGGRGSRSGAYPVFKREPDETAVVDLAQNISNILNNYARAAYYDPFAKIMEGVKAGLIDPNEAMVQGTRGGELFRKYFGVRPPEAPVPEMREEWHPYNNQQTIVSDEVTPLEMQFERQQVPTGRKIGGFTPATLEQLQRHVIRESASGRDVPAQLFALSGLLKTRAQQNMIDPQLQRDIEIIKQNPKMMREFTRLRVAARDDVTDADIIGSLRAAFPTAFEGAVAGSGGFKSLKEKEIESANERAVQANITKERIAQWRHQAYVGTWENRIKAQREMRAATIAAADQRLKSRLASEESRASARNFVSMVNHFTKYVGLENAHTIADEMVYGDGDWENIPETIREVAQNAFKKNQEFLDAKIADTKARPEDRQENLRLRKVRLEQQGIQLEETLKRWAMQDFNRAELDKVKMQIRALEVMTKDPAARATATLNAKRYLKEWGVEAEDPETIWTMMTRMASGIGMQVGFISDAPASKPFNPPQITPKQRDVPTVPKGPKVQSKAVQDFMKKYGVQGAQPNAE